MTGRIMVLLTAALLSGCLGGAGKAPFVRQYVLEYPPAAAKLSPFEAAIRVEGFSVDRLFAGYEMIFSAGPFLREAYPVQRWRVMPADRMTELIRRDLRHSGLFRAVLTERDADEVRFALKGVVEECFEKRRDGRRRAVLAATLTLFDQSRRETGGWVVFQKPYRFEADVTGEGAAGLAEALSRAAADLSRQAIADIASALGQAI
jgi:ABC-type uncharacterized transport system auxiliary subunit